MFVLGALYTALPSADNENSNPLCILKRCSKFVNECLLDGVAISGLISLNKLVPVSYFANFLSIAVVLVDGSRLHGAKPAFQSFHWDKFFSNSVIAKQPFHRSHCVVTPSTEDRTFDVHLCVGFGPLGNGARDTSRMSYIKSNRWGCFCGYRCVERYEDDLE